MIRGLWLAISLHVVARPTGAVAVNEPQVREPGVGGALENEELRGCVSRESHICAVTPLDRNP